MLTILIIFPLLRPRLSLSTNFGNQPQDIAKKGQHYEEPPGDSIPLWYEVENSRPSAGITDRPCRHLACRRKPDDRVRDFEPRGNLQSRRRHRASVGHDDHCRAIAGLGVFRTCHQICHPARAWAACAFDRNRGRNWVFSLPFWSMTRFCLVMAPLVIDVTRALRRNPVTYLLAVAMASNAGSAATFTGSHSPPAYAVNQRARDNSVSARRGELG